MNSSSLWDAHQSAQMRGRSMEQPIYSRTKVRRPKFIALEFPGDHTPTDPTPTLRHTRGEGSAVPLSLASARGRGRILRINRYPLPLKCSATGLNPTLTFDPVA